MKKAIYLMACLLTVAAGFAQQHLPDGIYVLDQKQHNRNTDAAHKTAPVQFNPAFVTEDPENYEPLRVITNDYFPFAKAGNPVMQYNNREITTLLLQLTEDAKTNLQQFTTRNQSKKIAVVINNQALNVYTADKPITSGLIIVTKCNKQTCNQIFEKLKQPSVL